MSGHLLAPYHLVWRGAVAYLSVRFPTTCLTKISFQHHAFPILLLAIEVSGGVKLHTAMDKDGIVLNRMYVGDYLYTNLGHEVINMFQAEDEKHYLYLNAKGNFTKKGKRVGTMLLVRGIGEGRVEVVGMAKNLKCVDGACCTLPRDLEKINTKARSDQNAFLKNVKYGNVSIFDIFGTQGQQSVYASYWVTNKEFFVPKEGKRLIIEFSNSSKVKEERIEGGEYITLTNHNFASHSLHQFILEGEDLDRLKELCDVEKRADIWRLDNTKLSERNIRVEKRKISLFDICQIQNDENRFSYALQYFMEQYPRLWVEFFAQKLNIELSENFTVTREEEAKIKKATSGKNQMTQSEELSADSEKGSTTNSDKSKSYEELPSGGRIDLLIRDNDKKNIIVIENKIKSDINLNSKEQKKQQKLTTELTSKQNTTQLDRYFNYINWRTGKYSEDTKIPTPPGDDQGKTSHFFILAPNYNKPENTLSGKYKVITYKELYNFLKLRSELKKDANFKAFVDAMHRHTHNNINDYLYYEMMEKFAQRINHKQSKNNRVMIKVQTFVTNSHNTADHNKLSNGINKFLAENDVEVVDIKYSTCSCVDSMGKIHWIPSALMIYKEKQ